MSEVANNRPLLRATGVTKIFPGTVALDHVDFTLQPAEVHALELLPYGASRRVMCLVCLDDSKLYTSVSTFLASTISRVGDAMTTR